MRLVDNCWMFPFYACHDSDPPGDTDLQCETRNLQSVECHWTVGRDTHLSLKSPTVYQLLGRYNKTITGVFGVWKQKKAVSQSYKQLNT